MSSSQSAGPSWPPAWNPYHLFLLGLALVSSIGLLHGESGSQVLDDRLNTLAVVMWGAALAVGSALGLVGVLCYARPRRRMPGLYLERAGLLLVGSAAAIYTFVVILTAADIAGVRYAAAIQTAFALASFFRCWQAHRAIVSAKRIYRLMQSREA